MDFWGFAGIAISAASVIAAMWGVKSASNSFKESQAPQIGMYLSSLDPENIEEVQDLMFLNIKNFGQQTAKDVKVKFGLFDVNLFYENKSPKPDQTPYRFRNTSIYSKGIKSIAPGQNHKFIITNMIEVNDRIRSGKDFPPLKMYVTWSNGSKKFSDTIVVDFKDYLGQLHEISSARKINQNLKKIADNLQNR